MHKRERLNMSNANLALLSPMLDGVAVALKDVANRVDAIRAAAQVAEREMARPEQSAKRTPVYGSGSSDDPDRIVSIPEAARISSLSVDTLRRRHRDKWIQLSEGRVGMRRRDALMLANG
jgi:hypothetical protein